MKKRSRCNGKYCEFAEPVYSATSPIAYKQCIHCGYKCSWTYTFLPSKERPKLK